MQIEIDHGSGFCFGVTTAIKKAEEELEKGSTLYCLGDIVHNGMEVERLHEAGLITIDHEEMKELHGVKVLLRAHGEPPETYALAEKNNIEIIDATCPVVLQLQRRIKKQYVSNPEAQIVIFGKKGHAEVLGLVGQTESHALVFLVIRYLIRRHNDRMKLAEMAMEKGINVPESDRPIDKQSDEYLVKRGLRNAFLGAGLCAMFAWWEADFLAGIGALVFFYGLGQTLIGSLPAIKDWWRNRHGDQGTGYNGTPV